MTRLQSNLPHYFATVSVRQAYVSKKERRRTFPGHADLVSSNGPGLPLTGNADKPCPAYETGSSSHSVSLIVPLHTCVKCQGRRHCIVFLMAHVRFEGRRGGVICAPFAENSAQLYLTLLEEGPNPAAIKHTTSLRIMEG